MLLGDDRLAEVAWDAEQIADRLDAMADALVHLKFTKTAAIVKARADEVRRLHNVLSQTDEPA